MSYHDFTAEELEVELRSRDFTLIDRTREAYVRYLPDRTLHVYRIDLGGPRHVVRVVGWPPFCRFSTLGELALALTYQTLRRLPPLFGD